jgi:hypothetical protein
VWIFYIITVITAAGVALGEKRHYNTYYVIIAWEWFLCVFSVCFSAGCKWIKKGILCARDWENKMPFFIDLLWGKQVLKTYKIPRVRWGAMDWVGETTLVISYQFPII